MRKCKRCGLEDENNDATHHIIPIALGGKDTDGRDILCKYHHDVFHKRHYGIMLKLLANSELKEKAKKRTLEYYKWWLKNG